MKIAAVSVILNECDIIELFIRINARVIDRFYIVDNGSSDHTLSILEALKHEGFPITLWRCRSVEYQQDLITTFAMRQAWTEQPFDWVLPLDADEFIMADRATLETKLRSLPRGVCGSLNWLTYVPQRSGYFELPNPLYVLFRPRAVECRQMIKIAVPGSLVRAARLTLGNHLAMDASNRPFPSQSVSVRLGHVPVRSSQQIISKAIIGSQKLGLKRNRGPLQGFHWDIIAQTIQQNRYKLDDVQLRSMALNYSQLPADPTCDVDDDGPALGLEQDIVVYRELSEVNLPERLGAFIEELSAAIKRQDASSADDVRVCDWGMPDQSLHLREQFSRIL